MSHYLVARIEAHPHIRVRAQTEVTALHGTDRLMALSTTTAGETEADRHDCRGLFCFIGAQPATDWLQGVTLDENGFVLTDQQLDDANLPDAWTVLGRPPLPFETSIPGVFAVGDVRHGSMKRVAAAVGEGASAIRSVHLAIAPPL
jgi:thioredoxin reductase (NADPH)